MPASVQPLSAVIFDCDGVLVDSEPLHYQAFQKVLRPLGLEHDYERYVECYIGFDDRDAFLEVFKDAGRALGPDVLAQLIREKDDALQHIVSRGISTFPGVTALVRELAASRVPLAVASGSLHHEVERFVAALDLTEAFSVVVSANDVKRSKPDPETYLLAIERVKATTGLSTLRSSCCIAIEDTQAGIQSAKAAGLYVIAVTNSYPADQLHGADHVVESLARLDVARMISLLKEAAL